MPHDDIDHIPSFRATRDSDQQQSRPATRSNKPVGKGRSQARPTAPAPSGSGAGLITRLLLTISLVIAGVACAWVWQLEERMEQFSQLLVRYEQRISDLEDRLSDTDEGLSQNTATIAVRIRDLDSEVRKLWDTRNVNRNKISALEKQSIASSKKITGTTQSANANSAQLKTISADVAKLNSVAGDLQRLMSSGKSNQAEVERVADSLNRMNLEFAKLGKRVESNEEWVGSVNAFRRQANTTMTQLQASVRALEATP